MRRNKKSIVLSVIALVLVLLVALTVVAVMSKGFKNWDSFKEAVPKIEKPAEKTEKTTEKEEQKKDDASTTEQSGENTSSGKESETQSGSSDNKATEAETSVASLNSGKVFATAISDDEVEFTMYADPDNKYYAIHDEEFLNKFIGIDFDSPDLTVLVDGEITILHSFLDRSESSVIFGYSDSGNSYHCNVGMFYVMNTPLIDSVGIDSYFPYNTILNNVSSGGLVFVGENFEKAVFSEESFSYLRVFDVEMLKVFSGENFDTFMSNEANAITFLNSIDENVPAFSMLFSSENVPDQSWNETESYFSAFYTLSGAPSYENIYFYRFFLQPNSRLVLNNEKALSIFDAEWFTNSTSDGSYGEFTSETFDEQILHFKSYADNEKSILELDFGDGVFGRLVEVYESVVKREEADTNYNVYPIEAYVELVNNSDLAYSQSFALKRVLLDDNTSDFARRLRKIYGLAQNYSEENE